VKLQLQAAGTALQDFQKALLFPQHRNLFQTAVKL